MSEARVGNCPNTLPAVGDQRVEFSRPLKRCLCLTALLVRGNTRSHVSITVTPEHQLSNCELSRSRQGFMMYCVMWKGEEEDYMTGSFITQKAGEHFLCSRY